MDKIPVRLLRQENGASLVEFLHNGFANRVIVPSSEIDNSQCSLESLQSYPPYGVDWIDVVGKIDLSSINERLHRMGIWTWEDLETKPLAIRNALQACIEPVIKNILSQLGS